MCNSTSILDPLKRGKKPDIPADFFDLFFDTLMAEIEVESGILGQLTKRDRPTLPAGYFDQKFDFIEGQEKAPLLSTLVPSSKPILPASFFDQFPELILEATAPQKEADKQSSRIIPLWLTTSISAVAAALAIFFLIRGVNTGAVETIAESETDQEATYAAYLSYLDEDEIIDYMLEYDIDLQSTETELDEQLYEDYSIEDIEDFYAEDYL